MKLAIKVVPGAARDGIVGWLGDSLKVRVTAAPEKGRANAAVEKLVADALGVAPGRVAIVQGKSSARKVMEITGMDEDEVHNRLSERCAQR